MQPTMERRVVFTCFANLRAGVRLVLIPLRYREVPPSILCRPNDGTPIDPKMILARKGGFPRND